jgi:hypothetical protein
MSFNQSAVKALVDSVVSHALTLGLFETVNTHEPKSAPGNGLRLAIWADSITPVKSSGLAAVSGKVVLSARIYGNFMQKPEDDIDPNILTAVSTLMSAFSGDFDFGGTVRAVDLIGMEGTPMSAQAGYLNIDNKLYRVMTVTVPVIINDMWVITE